MIDSKKIREEVLKLGACDYAPSKLAIGELSVIELIDLMLEPKCLEFCMNNKYPTLEMLLPYESELAEKNVFIRGEHSVSGSGKYIIFGGDVSINLSDYEVGDIYICGGSVLVADKENSLAFVEDWGGVVMHEGDVRVFKKI